MMNTPSPTPSPFVGVSTEEAFERLGRITRQLHEAMTELGLEQGLLEVAQEIPDARDRLSHVGQMTETAANKVLNLIDVAQPECRNFKTGSDCFLQVIRHLRQGPPPNASDISNLMLVCEEFAQQSGAFADSQNEVLGDIMMTQDFQDLSGQIIKKVIDIISLTEKQLLSLLMNSAPENWAGARPNAELAGPQVPDKALKQDDVDDLLASLGF
jgi:chemotaxis protein CheZ